MQQKAKPAATSRSIPFDTATPYPLNSAQCRLNFALVINQSIRSIYPLLIICVLYTITISLTEYITILYMMRHTTNPLFILGLIAGNYLLRVTITIPVIHKWLLNLFHFDHILSLSLFCHTLGSFLQTVPFEMIRFGIGLVISSFGTYLDSFIFDQITKILPPMYASKYIKYTEITMHSVRMLCPIFIVFVAVFAGEHTFRVLYISSTVLSFCCFLYIQIGVISLNIHNADPSKLAHQQIAVSDTLQRVHPIWSEDEQFPVYLEAVHLLRRANSISIRDEQGLQRIDSIQNILDPVHHRDLIYILIQRGISCAVHHILTIWVGVTFLDIAGDLVFMQQIYTVNVLHLMELMVIIAFAEFFGFSAYFLVPSCFESMDLLKYNKAIMVMIALIGAAICGIPLSLMDGQNAVLERQLFFVPLVWFMNHLLRRDHEATLDATGWVRFRKNMITVNMVEMGFASIGVLLVGALWQLDGDSKWMWYICSSCFATNMLLKIML